MTDGDTDLIIQSFNANYQQLQIDSHIWENAVKTIQNLNVNGVLSKDMGDWLCCSIYSELQKLKLKDMRQEGDDGNNNIEVEDQDESVKKGRCNSWNMSLTELLRSFNLNIKKFLKRMAHWNSLAENSNFFQKEICDLKRRLGITLLLVKHYKRIFKQLYVLPQASEYHENYRMLYEFGWLLFLIVRNELPPFVTTNLVNGCRLLICTLELVYVNALEVHKSDIINRTFQGVPTNWCNNDFDVQELYNYSAMDAICSLMPELPTKGVCNMKNAFFSNAVLGLFRSQRLFGNDRFLRELIKDDLLHINISSLNGIYNAHVSDISEFDERIMLQHNPQPSTKRTLIATKDNGQLSSPLATRPLNSTQHKSFSMFLTHSLPEMWPTFISDAIGTEKIELLENTLTDMCTKFETLSDLNQLEAECRLKRIKGLYYALLDKMISDELKRKPTIRISQLLKPTLFFNSTLITCCLELVLHIYSTKESQQFPWLLNSFGIDAYEFQKIIELVVRHEHNLLPRNLIKYLQQVEQQCLLSLIWKKDSQIWWNLARTVIPTYQDVQSSSCQENVKFSQGATMICMRKFYYLGKQHLFDLCKSLCLIKKYSEIWHVVEHSIIVHANVLLQERHLDQLLMCAVFLCVRKACLRISFSDIIQEYRRQPYARRSTYRAVYMPDNRPNMDIINFYNSIYIRLMADYARKLQCGQYPEARTIKFSIIRPLQEHGNNIQIRTNGQNTNIFVSTPAFPRICLAPQCKAKAITEQAVPRNLKRVHSSEEILSIPSKRPNILKRRQTAFP